MRRLTASIAALLLALPLLCGAAKPAAPTATREAHPLQGIGEKSLSGTRTILSYGPRPSGSKALLKVQEQIAQRLQAAGLNLRQQDFEAATPIGKLPMRNLIGVYAGKSSRILMLACHLESKRFTDIRFVGANDAASACALILELIPHLLAAKLNHSLWFVFFDGEEAIGEWSATDSLYGSRQLVNELHGSGLLGSIHAMVLLDMVGDKDLGLALEQHSDARLQNLVREVGDKLGYSRYLFHYGLALEDDHLPFVRAGVPAIDLVDFRYGPRHSYFHTAADTIDKLSPSSLEIVGQLVYELFLRLDKELRP